MVKTEMALTWAWDICSRYKFIELNKNIITTTA